MRAWKGFPKEYWMYWVASSLAGVADRVSKIKMMSLILFDEAAMLIFYMLLVGAAVAVIKGGV